MTSRVLAYGVRLSMPRPRQPPTPETLSAPLPKWEEMAASSSRHRCGGAVPPQGMVLQLPLVEPLVWAGM